MTQNVKISKAQKRDLMVAATNDGIALGLCYGPWETLIRLGLAEQFGTGQNIRLTEAGWAYARQEAARTAPSLTQDTAWSANQ